MAKACRVVFSFDERSLESLQKITEQGRFASMADTVRESLQISRALQTQAQQGFTEVIVRNPETDEERDVERFAAHLSAHVHFNFLHLAPPRHRCPKLK